MVNVLPNPTPTTPGYSFAITCGQCGGEVRHENGAEPSQAEIKAVAQCVDCGDRWLVQVRMVLLGAGAVGTRGPRPRR